MLRAGGAAIITDRITAITTGTTVGVTETMIALREDLGIVTTHTMNVHADPAIATIPANPTAADAAASAHAKFL